MIHSPRQRRYVALSAFLGSLTRAFRTPKPRQRGLTFKLCTALVAVMAVLVGTAATAFANAANPYVNPPTFQTGGTADAANGTVTQNPDGSWTVTSGHIDVNVDGTWNWGALSGSSAQSSCTSRFGVGWAVDWAGVSHTASAPLPGLQGALPIGKKNGTGFFHIFDADMIASGNFYGFSGPCTPQELAIEPGHPSGPWSSSYTYSQGQVIPHQLCVNMYDLHGSPGHLNSGDEDPLHNHDNSIQTNDFNPQQGVGYCFTPTFVNSQRLIAHIYDCTNGATQNEVLLGTVSAAGPTPINQQNNPLDNNTVLAGQYTVLAGAPAGFRFVACGGPAPNTPLSTSQLVTVPANGIGTAIFYVAPNNPNLTIHKSTSATQATVGDSFDYTLDVANTGPATAVNAKVSDSIPAGLTIGTVTPSVGTCTTTNQNVNCDLGDMLSGATESVVIHVTVSGSVCGKVTNTGAIRADNNTTVTSNPVDVTLICPNPSLDITKSASATQVTAGDSFDYTLHVTSTGGATATSVTVTDSIPAGLSIGTITPSMGTCGKSGQDITCSLGDLAAANAAVGTKSATITIHVTTSTAVCGKVTNTGHAAASNVATVDSNPVDVIIICPNPALDITKSASATQVTAGDTFDYTLVVTSVGGATATSVTVTDAIPAGLTIGTVTPSVGTCTKSGQNVTCSLGDLAAANANGGTKSATITIHVGTSPTLCDTVTNTGHATASNVATVDSNPVDVKVVCGITAELVKGNDADNDGSYHQGETAPVAGQDVKFRVTLTNTSAVPVVIDSISDAFGSTTISPTCANAFLNQTVAAGDSLTCDFTLTGYSPAAGTSLENTATVNVHDKNDPSKTKTVTATSVVNTAGVPPLALTVVKTNDANGDGTYTKDETGVTNADVKFRVSVTNSSSVAVVLDSVTDVWPGATEFAPACASTLVGIPIAPGATVTCDFTVATYIPVSTDGAKVNTVTVTGHENGHPGNKTTQKDTSTVRGEPPAVLGTTVVRELPRTGMSHTFDLAAIAILLMALGLGLMLLSGRIPEAALALRSSALASPVVFSRTAVVVERRLGGPNRRKLKGR